MFTLLCYGISSNVISFIVRLFEDGSEVGGGVTGMEVSGVVIKRIEVEWRAGQPDTDLVNDELTLVNYQLIKNLTTHIDRADTRQTIPSTPTLSAEPSSLLRWGKARAPAIPNMAVTMVLIGQLLAVF